MSRRQKIFVQNQNVALAHLCCLCASSRRVRDTRRRNARAGEEGCENKEWKRVFSLSSDSLTTYLFCVVEEKERESILFGWRDLSISALNKTFEKRFPALPLIAKRGKKKKNKRRRRRRVAFGVVSKSICVITIKRDARRKRTRGGGQRESKRE